MCSSGHSVRARGRGFTLIEILVVVVILAVVTAGVLISVSTTGRDRELERESERMLALLIYTREQAEVRTREFGLLCTPAGYQFVSFDPRKNLWVTVETDGESMPVDVWIDDQDRVVKVTTTAPDIGDVTFEITAFGVPVDVQAPPADQVEALPSLGSLGLFGAGVI